MTVGELRYILNGYNDDAEVTLLVNAFSTASLFVDDECIYKERYGDFY